MSNQQENDLNNTLSVEYSESEYSDSEYSESEYSESEYSESEYSENEDCEGCRLRTRLTKDLENMKQTREPLLKIKFGCEYDYKKTPYYSPTMFDIFEEDMICECK